MPGTVPTSASRLLDCTVQVIGLGSLFHFFPDIWCLISPTLCAKYKSIHEDDLPGLPLLKLALAPLSSSSLARSKLASPTAHMRGVHPKPSLVSTSMPVHNKRIKLSQVTKW